MEQQGYIAFDLDGTLAYHEEGMMRKGELGEPIPGMREIVHKKLYEGYEVRILTARAAFGSEEEIRQIEDWCEVHLGVRLPVTCQKTPGMVELWDDKAVQVVPNSGERVDGVVEAGQKDDIGGLI